MYICLFIFIFSIYLSNSLSFYQYASLSIYVSTFSSIQYLSIHISIYLSICFSINQSIYICVYLSIYLYIFQSTYRILNHFINMLVYPFMFLYYHLSNIYQSISVFLFVLDIGRSINNLYIQYPSITLVIYLFIIHLLHHLSFHSFFYHLRHNIFPKILIFSLY